MCRLWKVLRRFLLQLSASNCQQHLRINFVHVKSPDAPTYLAIHPSTHISNPTTHLSHPLPKIYLGSHWRKKLVKILTIFFLACSYQWCCLRHHHFWYFMQKRTFNLIFRFSDNAILFRWNITFLAILTWFLTNLNGCSNSTTCQNYTTKYSEKREILLHFKCEGPDKSRNRSEIARV
jgi:hypothetical protein